MIVLVPQGIRIPEVIVAVIVVIEVSVLAVEADPEAVRDHEEGQRVPHADQEVEVSQDQEVDQEHQTSRNPDQGHDQSREILVVLIQNHLIRKR